MVENYNLFSGIVIAEKTVVTDSKLVAAIQGSEAFFNFTVGAFTIPVASSKFEGGKVLVVTLAEEIPSEQFRPVCLPPKGYVEKMVLSQSCQDGIHKKITEVLYLLEICILEPMLMQVTLNGGNVDKAQFEVVDQNSCSLSFLNSRECTSQFGDKFARSGVMRKDTKYINGTQNRGKGRGSLDIEPVAENYYKCHVGAVTSAANCNLPEIDAEAKCKHVEDDSCVGFVASGLKKKRAPNTRESNLIACGEVVKNDYTGCIVENYEEVSASTTYKKDNRMYKGVNCLHDFIKPEIPGCARGNGRPKPLGKSWLNNPCYRKRKGCYNEPKNRYYQNTQPFWTYWSKSMVKGVQAFAEQISKELGCNQCSVGSKKCIRGKGTDNPDTGESFLFWFDSCRDKWFFLGPSRSEPLVSDLPASCEVPTVYSDLESVTALMRETVAGKVKQISLYPKPVVVVLGPTGVGKSTTGNALISGNKKYSNCFATGSGATSKTKVTDWKVGKWLGRGHCITVVDTPGTDDTSGPEQDYENIKELTRFLKEDLKEIDIFLVMFKEQDIRFVPSMQKSVKLFESIFGKESFWSNVATEFTFWKFSEQSMKSRYENYCIEDDLNCPSIFSNTGFCEDCSEEDYYNYDYDSTNIEEKMPCYENCQTGGRKKKREVIEQSQDIQCKLMTASTTNALNMATFKNQDINQENMLEMVAYKDLDKSSFVERGCIAESENATYFYEKADFVSRFIKKTVWNERYNLGPEHNIPALFIHPVWDTSSDLECSRFNRETSRLWEVVNNMTPFKCTSICQAPEEIFLGTPHILNYLNQSSALIPYRTKGTFSLTCTLWNGIGLAGVRGQDIKWIQGWREVNITDDKRWSLTFTEDEKDPNQTMVKVTFKPRMTDIGLYDCTGSDVKEQSTLSYSTSQSLSYEAYAKLLKTNSNHQIVCILKIKKSLLNIVSYENQLKLHFAREISPEMIPRLEHFIKSTTKNTKQYSISSLTFDFSKESYDAFEGTYACKRMGKAGYSNSVKISFTVDASWTNWAPWSGCSKPCLPEDQTPGTRSRTRDCSPPKNGGVVCTNLSGSYNKTELCNIKCCPKDGKWSEWSMNNSCSKSCSNQGESPGVFSRTRTCIPAQCGGIECDGETLEGGECNSFETKPCPIAGNWGDWGNWSGCVASSNPCHGTNHRIRECNNPPPAFNGAECSGQAKDEVVCDIPNCPVDCVCNPFKNNWSTCSKTCSAKGETSGVQTNTRECIKESNSGQTCKQKYEVKLKEQLTMTQNCNSFEESPCPINGNWGEWQAWSDCQAETDPCKGKNTRKRYCDDPAPENDGHFCLGADSEQKFCDVPDCPVDCMCMDEDNIWTQCSQTCTSEEGEPGTQTSKRSCTEGANGGKNCRQVYGDTLNRSKSCNTFEESPCPIHGNWGEWTEWSSCKANTSPCNGKKKKTRLCNNPTPRNGGDDCPGPGKEDKFCDVPNCPVDCVCNPVNEHWGPCSATCTPIGGQPGRQTNERVCKEQTNGGKTCHQLYEVELQEPLKRSRECSPGCCPGNGNWFI